MGEPNLDLAAATPDVTPGDPAAVADVSPGTPTATPDVTPTPGAPAATPDVTPGTATATPDVTPGTPTAAPDVTPGAPAATPTWSSVQPATVLPAYSSKGAFMDAMRRRLLAARTAGRPSLLDFLLDANGNWQKGRLTTKSGRTIFGRYALSDPDKALVQAGHMEASAFSRAAGKPREFLMLEDADSNWLSGQTVENLGAFSSKPAVLIDGYPVDITTARIWEANDALPPGTVDSAVYIEPPPFF
jgi:Bacterial toxin 5